MALRIEFIEPYENKREMVITPSMAGEIRFRWATKDFINQKQRQFVENIKKILYSPEDVFCLHQYEVKKTFMISSKSKGYIMGCKHCTFTYPTDIEPSYPQDML